MNSKTVAVMPIPGTHEIETHPGPVARVNSFPFVNFVAPIGQPLTCDMRAQTTSIVENEGGGFTVLGAVDIGGVVMSADELNVLPGFTEFFPALLESGLAKLAAQSVPAGEPPVIDNTLPEPEAPPA
jgi:hypothetical protein